MQSKLGPTLHVRAFRVTVTDLKNGWVDCAQIWYTDGDQLLGYRESQLEAPYAVCTCRAQHLSRSFVVPKGRLTGYKLTELNIFAP